MDFWDFWIPFTLGFFAALVWATVGIMILFALVRTDGAR